MTEELNNKYAIVNKMIDNYIEDWSIEPKDICKYLKKGTTNYQRFLQRTGLAEMDKIDKIISDVIEDRLNMQLDGILTFEAFIAKQKINESILNIANDVDVSYEKILADYFSISLSHIDEVDTNKHLYDINVYGTSTSCIIYSNKDIENMMDVTFKKLGHDAIIKTVELNADGYSLDLKLSDIIDLDELKSYLHSLIESNLDNLDNYLSYIDGKIKESTDIDFEITKLDDYVLWVEKK